MPTWEEDSFKTRQFQVKDLDQVVIINRKCLPENYPSGFFIDLFERFPGCFLVAETSRAGVVGYIMCRIERGLSNYGFRLTKKGHVVSVAVLHDYRNKGIGHDLVSKAIVAMREYGAGECILEVRQSNIPAITLYKGLGFENSKVLKGYYSDGEDAYLMSLQLNEPS